MKNKTKKNKRDRTQKPKWDEFFLTKTIASSCSEGRCSHHLVLYLLVLYLCSSRYCSRQRGRNQEQ
jgi:hypothetical protein